ncbi:MAG: GntR family transcriptional regulator [Firmicutes bacterium]|nr:GntR family transcriptional regulator [Bacillota bacterium]
MKKTLADKAYDILEDKIVRLEYEPGSLISEKKLSEELGIGRMPIREAIKKLENAYLVKVMPHRGIMVTEIKMEEIFLQIEVRKILERLITQRATKYSTPNERKHFLDIADRYEQITAEGTPEEAVKIDNEFNEFVADCARNPFAAASLRPLHALARRLYFYQYYRDKEKIVDINMAHVKLMREIASGDETEAIKASDHIIDLIIALHRDNYMSVLD